MPPEPGRIVVDIGNSRIKWGQLAPDGRIARHAASEIDDPSSWSATIRDWDLAPRTRWAIGSVNPPAASAFEAMLRGAGMTDMTWHRSAASVPVPSLLPAPSRAGADRALAALAAIAIAPWDGPGLVVSCGTALTIERITPEAQWEGGAIAMGLGLAARTLNGQTAQLPYLPPSESPSPWGQTTETALAAGIFWGTVGSLRELIRRQDPPGSSPRWRIWTGGDAGRLAPAVEEEERRYAVVPDLVLTGLALATFGVPASRIPR